MSGLKMISPLLDHMIAEKETIGHNGQSCYTLRHEKSGERFVLKRMSVPESDSRIRALILSGAYPDEQAVHEYYGRVVKDIQDELELGKKLSASGSYAGALSYQVEPKDSGVGYDIYILYPLNISLSEFLTMNAMTSLRAINLGIDLCDALNACREAGYLYQNLKPENVFLMPTGKFLLGDLGLTSLEYLEYASVPEEYIGAYSAPEMSDITANPNMTVDVYALGMVLYRIYNGNHGPFEDESTNAVMADKLRLTGKPLPSPIYADYELAGIILKACAFKKEDRYQSPDAMKQALVLYMQRNAVSDALIVPPIVADLDPVPLIDEEIEEEPIRMTDVDALDDTFKESFSPDMSGAGDDTFSSEEESVSEPEPEPVIEEDPQEQPVEEDPNQIDLDGFLASINDYIEEDAEEQHDDKEPEEQPVPDLSIQIEATHDYVDAEADEPEEEPSEPVKKKSKILLWSTILILLVGIALAGYFLLNWYFVDVSELKTISTTPNQIIVEMVTDDKAEYFQVTCSDSYGNVYKAIRSGNQYCFNGLREKTSYTISVHAAKYHEFSAAAPVLTETTNEYTVISGMSIERLNSNGDVRLSFEHKGPVPSQWKLTYAKKDGTDSHTYRFDGESYQINGLELYATYVFTLENVDNSFMSGEFSYEYEVLPLISASELKVADIVDQTVKIVWECGEIVPEQWYVKCEAEDMDPIILTTKETTALITIPDLTRNYTFYVYALGMDDEESLLLNSNPIIVNHLTAQPDADGNLVVTWETPAGEPNGEWRVCYKLKNGSYSEKAGVAIPSVSCAAEDENSVVLKYLPADAEYEITLLALDTESNSYPRIFGTTTIAVTTPEATAFTGYQILPVTPYGDGYEADSLIALWEMPEDENWDYRDLLSARRTTYSTDERIALCIQIDSCDVSTDTVHLMYAVRNAEGDVITVDSREIVWNSVWFDRRHTGAVPMPLLYDDDGNSTVMTGEFAIEVYINGRILASKNFVIE